nr:MAG TPA: hypothetical protein [Caudoviricetes sp.]
MCMIGLLRRRFRWCGLVQTVGSMYLDKTLCNSGIGFKV